MCKTKAYKSLEEEEKCARLEGLQSPWRERDVYKAKANKSLEEEDMCLAKAYKSLEEEEKCTRLQGLQFPWILNWLQSLPIQKAKKLLSGQKIPQKPKSETFV